MMNLSIQQLQLVEQRVAYQKKSVALAYLLWFFLGGFAVHRFYLGKTGSAIGQLCCFWGGVIFSYVLIGLPFLLAACLWIFIDLFLIPSMVSSDTQALRLRIMNEVAASTMSQPHFTPHHVPAPPPVQYSAQHPQGYYPQGHHPQGHHPQGHHPQGYHPQGAYTHSPPQQSHQGQARPTSGRRPPHQY